MDEELPDSFTLPALLQPNLEEVLAGCNYWIVLAAFNYNGQDAVAIQGASSGHHNANEWIPTIITLIAAGVMTLYPLNQNKMMK